MGRFAKERNDYLSSPDMIALTLGRIVALHLSRNMEVSHYHIRARLGSIIDQEPGHVPVAVSKEMAIAAMAHLNRCPG
ncbi:hypothetical protein [Paracoccus laeviglucosivorans]|uniref:Uncharacterized protein n=1 Tax=Paracoccus laeviglucosivorans TaxID=1197861 RepID=A0A521EL99_9RHOB|nr:hypothetical protein [Paracoccus laeviglucosivorans]SMO84696.1 hypothetical protein SAMN06265221_1142 [Paracoccus laeviglucosivorans]